MYSVYFGGFVVVFLIEKMGMTGSHPPPYRLQHNLAKIQADAMPEHYEAELEINDFQQNARWKVTHKETLGPISEWTGAAITTRGQYFAPASSRTRGTKAVLVHHFLVQRNLADIQFFNSKSFIIRC